MSITPTISVLGQTSQCCTYTRTTPREQNDGKSIFTLWTGDSKMHHGFENFHIHVHFGAHNIRPFPRVSTVPYVLFPPQGWNWACFCSPTSVFWIRWSFWNRYLGMQRGHEKKFRCCIHFLKYSDDNWIYWNTYCTFNWFLPAVTSQVILYISILTEPWWTHCIHLNDFSKLWILKWHLMFRPK